ncbi:type VI secretion system protein TssA [Pseudomonas sp. SWRI107]|uniref:type VI secretion system protein TssA n=1 Tax=Pseudomonas farsensis TaxID=2745492 RepID=UPI00164514B6|nr:type VI secretion system protein TssA [Pseudomonas farsensis]MBV4533928.1 type VI secretion system protein TssA [Pseudomonas farsensis]
MSLVMAVPSSPVDRLLLPIDPRAPAGLFDSENETFQAIDQEMVKLGGLQTASIDWSFVEEASCQYLERSCKHFRIAAHLSAAWLRNPGWGEWGNTARLLAGMVQAYWEPGYPKPGPTGFIGKRRLVERVANRLAETLPKLERGSYSPAAAQLAQNALAQLQQGPAQLADAGLGELQRLLALYLECANEPQRCAAPMAAVEVEPAPVQAVISAVRPSSASDNPRETRRALLSMADLANQHDPYDPVGYQLRRFAMWAHIDAAPNCQPNNRTQLLAIPPELSSGYVNAMAGKAVELGLLKRIETSVAASPYWFRGSFMAASVASRLAMDEVAEGIRSATARFAQRLPALQQLCFSDGSVFMDEQTFAWLKSTPEAANAGGCAQAFAELRKQLLSQLEAGGVEPVLFHLQSLQRDLRTPRERCHTTLIAAELLAARGMPWLAQDLYAGIARLMQETTADAWEPDVFRLLQQPAARPAQADHDKGQKP